MATTTPTILDQISAEAIGFDNAMRCARHRAGGDRRARLGRPVTWLAAPLRPDRFPAVIALSVPFRARGTVRPTSVMPRPDDAVWYQLYFQEPGVAEAAFDRNVRTSMPPGIPAFGKAVAQQDRRPGSLLRDVHLNASRPTMSPSKCSSV